MTERTHWWIERWLGLWASHSLSLCFLLVSFQLSLSVCLTLCPPMSDDLSPSLSIYVSISSSLYLCIHPSIDVSCCPFIYPFIYLFSILPLHLSIQLSIFLSIYLTIPWSVHHFYVRIELTFYPSPYPCVSHSFYGRTIEQEHRQGGSSRSWKRESTTTSLCRWKEASHLFKNMFETFWNTLSPHLLPSLAVKSLSQKRLGIDIVRAVRKDKYEPLQVTPFPVLRVSRLFYLFAHLDLLSTDSSLLWSYFFFLSLLWLFPPLLLHLSISSEVWLLNFLRWIQIGCILETKQTHTHTHIYIYMYTYTAWFCSNLHNSCVPYWRWISCQNVRSCRVKC